MECGLLLELRCIAVHALLSDKGSALTSEADRRRGLTGVKLVISDAHVGLTKAIRNLLQCVPKVHQGMVTAALAQRVRPGNRWGD
jgi:hypothetical protein